jgi:myo-inositol-1(or 4)-monophosphatase
MMKNTLINALNFAGQIQREKFRKSLTVSIKESASSILTEVDLACEKVIFDTIRNSFPGHNLLGEESGLINNHSNYTWVVDPLDGTSNFAAGLPWFGILIAVFDKSVPVMAGSLIPLENSMCYAALSEGTWISGERIHITDQKLTSSLIAFSMDYTDDEPLLANGMTIYRHLLKNARNVRSTNSLLDFQFVVEGKLGGCINLFTKIWDIAASYLFLKEAGGMLVGLDGKEVEFDLNESGTIRTYPVAAGSPGIIRQLEPLFSAL